MLPDLTLLSSISLRYVLFMVSVNRLLNVDTLKRFRERITM